MKKIIFIVNSLQQPPCHKRIQEFLANGYEVQAYGFSRGGGSITDTEGYSIQNLGEVIQGSYFKRLPYIISRLKPVINKYKHDKNAVFYFFMMDCALAGIFAGARKYIYEVYDTTELTVGNGLLRKILKRVNKYIMSHSLETVFTSEGFVDCYFEGRQPNNVSIIPNKINSKILNFPSIERKKSERLSIGFVGNVRYLSVLNFMQVCAQHPEIDMHLYGILRDREPFRDEFLQTIESAQNITFHGSYKNPNDLPRIYADLDMVLAVYPPDSLEVQYAEPNKLYEAIYFEKPIIVSKDVFLGKKVERLGVGFTINAMDKQQIDEFLTTITPEKISEKVVVCSRIDKSYCINHNADFFNKIKHFL